MLVDAKTKCAHEKDLRGNPLLVEDVVLRLINIIFNKGYIVTTDNSFVSVSFVRILHQRGMTIMGDYEHSPWSLLFDRCYKSGDFPIAMKCQCNSTLLIVIN